MDSFPNHTRVVVIGGGVVGCAVAYHLARLGWRDCVLLERGKLTCGTTFHAAGLVGQLRSSPAVTEIIRRSVKLYEALELEMDTATGWRRSGGLRLARSALRLKELEIQAAFSRKLGIEVAMLAPFEAIELCPIISTQDLVGASFVPSDGQINPSDVTQALAKGASRHGARVIEDCPVVGFEQDSGGVRGVLTPHGRIACDIVVVCAGQWTRDLAAKAGVMVPLISIENQYVITEPMPGVNKSTPTVRDMDNLLYFKEEVGGLALGGYPRRVVPWAEDGIPPDFVFSLLNFNWDHFAPIMDRAVAAIPGMTQTGIKSSINGPESATPDGNFILGEAPECAHFYVAAGFNGYGIAAGGGAGLALAEWIIAGAPQQDLGPVDIRRFSQELRDLALVRRRTMQAYGTRYDVDEAIAAQVGTV